MSAYEEMKAQIMTNLMEETALDVEEIRRIMQQVDRAAAGP